MVTSLRYEGHEVLWIYVLDVAAPPDRARQGDDGSGSSAPSLTNAELAVLAALDDLSDELGHAPTYAEILERLDWRSRGTLHRYLQRLGQKGVVAGSGRSLRVVR
jgi:hypothetical protein